ncbi:MAG TPA: hypothetical protein VFS08_04080 [Gemmatimonadaceae bacterium]|nr:hypothetical protein [Gemmatimonadaceae bacterium]
MEDRKHEGARPRDADRGREGFGDDQGTRVGRPDPAQGADQHTGPSTRPVKEGLEGAVLEGDEDAHGRGRVPRSASSSGRGSTGAGAEAAEGTEGAQQRRDPEERSSVDARSSSTRGGVDRRGSEPLADRDATHVSGYGGSAGQPKHSSDQREGTK